MKSTKNKDNNNAIMKELKVEEENKSGRNSNKKKQEKLNYYGWKL